VTGVYRSLAGRARQLWFEAAGAAGRGRRRAGGLLPPHVPWRGGVHVLLVPVRAVRRMACQANVLHPVVFICGILCRVIPCQESIRVPNRFQCRMKGIGWRLDYALLSPSLVPRLHDAWLLPDVLGSDHLPLGVTLTGQNLLEHRLSTDGS
jgi:hypothetical protein